MDDNATLAIGDTEIGNILNSFFASVFTDEDTTHFLFVKQVYAGHDSDRLVTFKT